jgi:predicted nucleotidyltransferase
MASVLQRLTEKGLINPPSYIPHNVMYETIMGSVAYGVSADTSDFDCYGFFIPPKDHIFPHLAGEIEFFGINHENRRKEIRKKRLVFQQHHIFDASELAGKGRKYDISMYSIVQYLQLCMENNPNMIDSMFTPHNCVLHLTKVGSMIRDKRREFLHRGAWHTFKGYAYGQLHKMTTKEPEEGSNRAELREKYGFDVKFAYNIVRLLYEVEQVLTERDIDLQRHREHLKAIRRGEMTEKEIRRWCSDKEAALEKVYHESTLPYGPDEQWVKKLLLECVEEHYGSLAGAIVLPNAAEQSLKEIMDVLERYQKLLAAAQIKPESEG